MTSPRSHVPAFTTLIGWALLLLVLIPAPAIPQSPAPLPMDPAIRKGTLENGLTYYIRQNSRPEKRAELRLAVNAGSILEEGDQLGLAHFVEHMAFNGTKNFARQELVDYLQSVGVRFGADLNAYTSFDETVYLLQIPTDSAQIVEKAFDILEDWAHQVTFDSLEVEKERGVVIEEWRLGRGPDARIRDKQLPVLLKGSRYADRLPIGTKEGLESFRHSSLKRFYRDWYRPDLMAVVAVGDFEPATIESLIRRHFLSIPKRSGERERTLYPVPDHLDTLYSIAADPEMDLTIVGVDILLDRESEATDADYRRSLVRQLATGMFNARLAELTRQSDPPFLQAYGSRGGLVRTKDVFALTALVRQGGAGRGLEALMTEQKRVDRFGFTAGELDRQKQELLRFFEQAYQERMKTESARLADEYVRNFLSEEPAPGIAFEFMLASKFIPDVTLDEVNALWQTIEGRSNVVVSVSGPDKPGAALPTESSLAAILSSVASAPASPYVDNVAGQSLLPALPEGGTIVAESRIPELDLIRWELSNGVTVFLKQTDFKNDQILLSGFAPGGTSLAPDSGYLAAMTATAVVQECGLGAFSQTELDKLLAGKIASASAYCSELEQGINGTASPKDLKTLMELVYLRFTAPRKDTAAFSGWVSRMRGMIENRSMRPESAFDDTLQVTLANHHVRRQPITAESLTHLDLDKSYAFYKQRFADASNFTFILVGTFAPDSVRALVARYLGGLPSLNRGETWRDVGVRTPSGFIRKEIHRGIEPKSQVRAYFTGPFHWSQENRASYNAMIEVLRITLRETLREDRGGTYGVSVGGSPSQFPIAQYRCTVSFGCSPAAVDTLLAAMLGQIDSLKTAGPAPATLEKVKETYKRERETAMKQNGFWVGALHFLLSNREDPRDLLRMDQRMAGMTVEAVRTAARTYLHPEAYLLGIMYPAKEER